MKPRKNITGQSFGRLTALEPVGRDKYGKTLWKCDCSCGNTASVQISSLISGNAKSCGCNRSKAFVILAAERKLNAFGIHHKRARNSWHHMIDRCENPANKHFADYGGRGISVCDRWRDLKLFVADMGDPPDGKTLDRWPDMNGNYEPGNCRWATPMEQARNTRRTVFAEFDGKNMCIAEIADQLKMPRSTLYARIASELKKIEARVSSSRQTTMPF